MNKKRWNSINKMSLALLFILVFSMVFSFQLYSMPSLSPLEDSNSSNPQMAAMDYYTPITGDGNNRTLRMYLANASSTTGSNTFNISSESDDEYLSRGQLNYTFEKNYNTTYEIEDDSPLTLPKSRYYSTKNDAFVQTGTINSGTNASIALNNNEQLKLTSTSGTPKLVEVNFTADFSNYTASNKTVLGYKIDIKALNTQPLLVNVSANDYIDGNWDEMISEYSIETSNVIQTKSFYVMNEQLRYFDDLNTKNCTFGFQFYNGSSSFDLNIYYVSITILTGEEAQISSNNAVALEFDTKGNCTVYGFYAWVRSFNTSATDITSNLTIQLYETNQTTPVARSVLLDQTKALLAEPEVDGTLLAEMSYLNYSGDSPTWFNFSSDFSGIDLNISNYFVVISSNTSTNPNVGKYFTITTLPYSSPDGIISPDDDIPRIDHLLLTNSTGSWKRYTLSGWPTYPCDAAPFALNLTRAWKASELNASIEEEFLSDAYNQDYPHDETGNYATYWWGLGQIDHTYDESIKAVNGNFTVNLNWNRDDYSGPISYSVDYNVTKYFADTARAEYLLQVQEDVNSEDELPHWNVSFVLDQANYPNWQFVEMWYFVPNDWDIYEFIAEDGDDYLYNVTLFEFLSNYNETKEDVLMVKKALIDLPTNGDGTYSLLANQTTNYIKSVDLNLHYGEKEWPSNGFMRGDNVSVHLGVKSSSDTYISSGNATIRLFDPNGQIISSATLNDTSIDKNSTYSNYFFDQLNILETDQLTELGEYMVIANWTDGNEVGVFKRPLYVNHYDLDLLSVNLDENLGSNQIRGLVDTFPTDLGTYDLYLYAVQELLEENTDYLINQTFDDDENILSNNIALTMYAQNETFFNPNEEILFKIGLKNFNTTLTYDVSIKLEIYSYYNDEWIIAEGSSVEKTLDIAGVVSGNDAQMFDLSITIPDNITGGTNCPIRNGPMMVRWSIMRDGISLYDQYQNEFFYYSSQSESEFEGKVLEVNGYQGRVGPSFISNFDRENLELPGTIYYYAQAINDYQMTNIQEEVISKSELKRAEIANFQVLETYVNHSSVITLTGDAVDEFGISLSEVELELYYKNVFGFWNAFNLEGTNENSFNTSNEDGSFEVSVSMLVTPIDPEVEIQIRYAGNASIAAFNQSLEVEVLQYESAIDFAISENSLTSDAETIIIVSVHNIGNSTLSGLNITIVNTDFAATLYYSDNFGREILSSGEIYEFQIVFSDDYSEDTANITLKVDAIVDEDMESFTSSEEFVFDIYRSNQQSLFNTLGVIAFFIAVIGLWIFGVYFVRSKVDEMNKIPEEESKDKTTGRKRTGKYVKVSELSRKEKAKKDQSSDQKTGESTSLDDLLEKEDNSSKK